jgi:hypothetical protein
MIKRATYCGILNENWIVVTSIYSLNFLILGETTMNLNHIRSYQLFAMYVAVSSKLNNYLYFSKKKS